MALRKLLVYEAFWRRRKFGEVYAFVSELYVGGFTTVSFLIVAYRLILRYLQIVP